MTCKLIKQILENYKDGKSYLQHLQELQKKHLENKQKNVIITTSTTT